MNILLTGAGGFIGGHLRAALRAQGHSLRLAARHPPPDLHPGEDFVPLDLASAGPVESWRRGLAGVDVVVNAVGILRERGAQTFQALHVDGPAALFAAAAEAGVRRIVHISALGADEQARSAYHLSKKAGDERLLGLPVEAVVVQPSLVFGPGGASARLFTMLAALPLLPLPGGGHQPVQPIHIDDLVACMVALVTGSARPPGRVALVGPTALELREYLQALRRSMGLKAAWTVAVPAAFVAVGATLAGRIPASPLDPETWQMLQRGNVAPVAATRDLLGRMPRPAEQFIAAEYGREVRRSAMLDVFLPLFRVAIALVWIVTGIVSLGVYPVEASYELLRRAGVTGALAPWALYGAAALDLAFGAASLLMKRRRWLWLAQIALILGYSAIISVRLPEFWLHPYGPLLKNLPMLALLWMLYVVDREGASR